MIDRIEEIVRDIERYERKECLIYSLLTVDDDDYGTWCCDKCEHVWQITDERNGYVFCLLDIDLDLDEVR